MAKIDVQEVEVGRGSSYPAPFDKPCLPREWRRLGDAAGLTHFGVNIVRLPPGVWSSQRHWHQREDEFVYVLEGELVLVTDAGQEVMRPGDCAGFPAGVRDGHHLQNRSDAPAVFLVVGSRDRADHGEYPDIDMKFTRDPAQATFQRKDGTPY